MKMDFKQISKVKTDKLHEIWDETYLKREQNCGVFQGNVQKYDCKQILNSNFIILRNQSRIKKKVDTIAQKLKLQSQNQSKNDETKGQTTDQPIIIPLDQKKDFCFKKIYAKQFINHFDASMSLSIDNNEKLKKQSQNKLCSQIQEKNLSNQQKVEFVHAVIINKFPICPKHCVFVPWIDQALPQKITLDSIKLVLNLLNMYQNLSIGFNSVGAAASVNNLHFHMFFKQYWIKKYQIPIEKIENDKEWDTTLILEKQNIKIQTFNTPIIQGFLISLPVQSISMSMKKEILEKIYKIPQKLIQLNIAHNLFIIKKDSLVKIFIFPRKYQCQFDSIKFACMQFVGVFCLDYQSTTKELIESLFLKIKIQEQKFNKIKNILFQIYQSDRENVKTK